MILSFVSLIINRLELEPENQPLTMYSICIDALLVTCSHVLK